MVEWQFETVSPALVELEPTQRDQFNNDEVGLADALVREAIQNSTDAPQGKGVVKVRFDVFDLDAATTGKLRQIMNSLRPHLRACDVDDTPIDERCARLVVVEDFNTSGLTGSIDTLDGGNFRNFWRRHGKSDKTGKAMGRWGLGKLVYSSSSRVHAFLGLTRRQGENRSLLMGQAVLQTHDLEGARHPPHGFWFSDRAENELQLPVEDPAVIAEFSELAHLEREGHSGLSIVIPYALPSITEEALVSGVVHNYYFPILAGRLEVQVGLQELNRQTFFDAASQVDGNVPFEFVTAVSDSLTHAPPITATAPIGDEGLTEEHFSAEMLSQLRKEFESGKLLKVRAPVKVYPLGRAPEVSYIDLFLQKPRDAGNSYSLFVRGSLTVPAERKNFAGVPAYGAMVATDSAIAAFLGDAENPAHTSWNGLAEKVTTNWESPYAVLRPVRAALRSLYQLVGEEVPQLHEDLLNDFFSILDAIPRKGRKKKKSPITKIEIERRERAIVVEARSGGFRIVAGPGAANWTYPRLLRVRTAYDLVGGNPFKRHSTFDFDIAKEIQIEVHNAQVAPISANSLRLTALGPDFSLVAHGFDENRDLVIEARTV